MAAQPISAQLADRLAKMILDGEYRPGEQLPTERELAEQLGASRTMVREAAKLLEARGLVEIRRGVGTFVSSTPGVASDPLGIDTAGEGKSAPEIILDWYRVRMILEGEAMEMVAANATDAELDELAALLETELQQASTDYEDFLETDRSFHCALAHATHNIIMTRLIPSLHASVYYDLVRDYYPFLRQKFNDNVNTNHAAIVRHLKLRDGRGANLAMRCHMLQGISDVRALAEKIE